MKKTSGRATQTSFERLLGHVTRGNNLSRDRASFNKLANVMSSRKDPAAVKYKTSRGKLVTATDLIANKYKALNVENTNYADPAKTADENAYKLYDDLSNAAEQIGWLRSTVSHRVETWVDATGEGLKDEEGRVVDPFGTGAFFDWRIRYNRNALHCPASP